MHALVATHPVRRVGLTLLAVLQIADALTTHFVLAGGGVERNAAMRPVAGSFALMLAVKAAVCGCLWLATWALDDPRADLAVVALGLLYTGVILNNILVLI